MTVRYARHSADLERIMITSRTEQPTANGLFVERRRTPDRRTTWRGGRRDSDWINRPPDARLPFADDQRPRRWTSMLLMLHFW
jgi:hypothetical protein